MKLIEIKLINESKTTLKRDFAFITKNLKDNEIADDDGFECEENPNAIYGNLTSTDSVQYYINCVDLDGTGKYTLEVQQRGKKKMMMQDEDVNAQNIVWAISSFLKNH